MTYIGQQPSTTFDSGIQDRFTGLTTNTVTLTHEISAEEDILVVWNNIVQDKNSYSVGGTGNKTLTLGGTLVSADIVTVYYTNKVMQSVNPTAGSVTSTTITDDIISGQTALGAEPANTDEFIVSDAGTLKRVDYSHIKGKVLTVADFWLLTSSFQGDADPISSNLSKAVSVTSNVTTQSSGVFSFPLTGFYLVTWNVVIRLDSGSEKGNFYTRFTTDNSSYDFFSAPITMTSIGTNSYTSTMSQRIVDVTDTSLCKIKFGVDVSNTDTYTRGGSAPGETANRFTFMRLGDT